MELGCEGLEEIHENSPSTGSCYTGRGDGCLMLGVAAVPRVKTETYPNAPRTEHRHLARRRSRRRDVHSRSIRIYS